MTEQNLRSIFAPQSIDDVRERFERLKVTECDCDVSPHLDLMHDLVVDDVPWMLDELARLTKNLIQK